MDWWAGYLWGVICGSGGMWCWLRLQQYNREAAIKREFQRRRLETIWLAESARPVKYRFERVHLPTQGSVLMAIPVPDAEREVP